MRFLNTKLWKLPYWAWGLILVAVIAAYIIYRRNAGGGGSGGLNLGGAPSSGVGNALPFPQQPAPLPPIGIGSTPTGSSGIPGPADVPAAPLASVGTAGFLPTTQLSSPITIGINGAVPSSADPSQGGIGYGPGTAGFRVPAAPTSPVGGLGTDPAARNRPVPR